MTDAATIDATRLTTATLDTERAERIARLRQRRSEQDPVTAAPAPSGFSPPTVATTEIPVTQASPASPRPRRRRSPATNAKIITVGASATAMFGMIAGYGIADGLTSESGGAAAPDAVTTAATPLAPVAQTVPPASPTVTPVATTPPPQVIVVVVDGTTGRTLSTTAGTGDLATDLAAVGVTATSDQPAAPPSPAPVEQSPVEPAPVAPTAVDLAVPAPPPPPAAPAAAPAAPAAAPAPAPQPQATSSGS